MRIFITGASGRLGSLLVNLLQADGHVVQGADIIASDSVTALDITDFAATREQVTAFKPDIVLHPAAWTDVDGCALNPDKAVTINGYGTQNVALAAKAADAAVLYVSSNEVFAGRGTQLYREYDPPQPANPYGYSKWVGEQTVIRATPKHYITRTSWLFAHGGKNFIQAILGAAEAGKTLRVVTNEVANPTYTDDLAAAIVRLIQTERYGIYHLVNAGYCSRYAFARYALDQAGYMDTPITPISSYEWQRPSQPPPFSPLQNLAGESVGVSLRPWQSAVSSFLDREGLLKPQS